MIVRKGSVIINVRCWILYQTQALHSSSSRKEEGRQAKYRQGTLGGHLHAVSCTLLQMLPRINSELLPEFLVKIFLLNIKKCYSNKI